MPRGCLQSPSVARGCRSEHATNNPRDAQTRQARHAVSAGNHVENRRSCTGAGRYRLVLVRAVSKAQGGAEVSIEIFTKHDGTFDVVYECDAEVDGYSSCDRRVLLSKRGLTQPPTDWWVGMQYGCLRTYCPTHKAGQVVKVPK